MSIGGRTFRAFRPSSFARQDELEEEEEQAKQANIVLYGERARAGLPLFDATRSVNGLTPGQNFALM